MFHGRLFHAEERTTHFEHELLRSLLIQDLGCLQHHQVLVHGAVTICTHAEARLMEGACGFASTGLLVNHDPAAERPDQPCLRRRQIVTSVVRFR